MKQLSSITACILFLTACAYTPAELSTKGKRFDFASDKAPASAAKCISRTADDSDPSLTSQIRDGLSAGSYEVVIRLINETATTVGLFKIKPHANGSEIEGYISPNILSSRERFAKALVGNC